MIRIYFYLLICFFITRFDASVAQLSSCSPFNSTLEPKVKTINNKNCFFPFSFKNQIYDDCASYGTTSSKFCPTTCNLESDNELSLCRWEKKNLLEPSCANITSAQPSKEPSTETNGTCIFPFFYKGKCYNDCILLGSYKLWCGTTESLELNPSQFIYCYYNRSILEKKGCENLTQAKLSIHPETINNGTCTFPFVYNGICYEDCVEHEDYWCSFTKGYETPNFGYCKYLRNFKKYEVSLKYGIYAIYSYCSQGDFCGSPIVATNTTVKTLVQIGNNNSKYLIDRWEILPQPNNSIIIRTPKLCPLATQTAWTYSLKNQLILDELKQYKLNTRFILNPHKSVPNIYFLTEIVENKNDSNSILGFQISTQSKTESIPLEKYPIPLYWTFQLKKELDVNVNEDPCKTSTTTSVFTPPTTNQMYTIPMANKFDSDILTLKITVSVTIAICLVILITVFVIIIIMCRN